MSRSRLRRFTIISLMVLVGLVSSVMPAAALTAVATLADQNVDFVTGGNFRLTGLGAPTPGGIQLLPATTIRPWLANNSPLPIPLMDLAAIGYGRQLFVIGGRSLTDNQTLTPPTTTFFGAHLAAANETTGQLSPWIKYSDQAGLALPVGLSQTSLAIAETAGGTYLYAVGGMKAGGQDIISSNSIFYSKLVDTDGDGYVTPQPWQTIAIDGTKNTPLPHIPSEQSSSSVTGGGAAEMGVSIQVINDVPNLVLFGGHNRTYDINFSFRDVFYDAIFRSPINNDGTIVGWNNAFEPNDRITQVTFSGGVTTTTRIGNTENTIGLAGTTALTYINPITNREAVYLLGGRKDRDNTELLAYSALMNDNGSLSWQRTSSLPFKLIFHSSIQSNGSLFALGGAANADDNNPQPQNAIQAAVIEDDMQLANPGEGLSSFTRLENALDTAQGPRFRQNHGNASIDAGANGQWIYVMGGRLSTSASTLPVAATTEVLIGRFGFAGDPTNGQFARQGSYSSRVFDYRTATTFKQFRWRTILPDNTQIKIGYRVSNDPSVFTRRNPPAPIYLPDSVNGDNTASLPDSTEGRYLQFVAQMSTAISTTSPLLDFVRVQLEQDGFPNFKVEEVNVPNTFPSNAAAAPTVSITNAPYNEQTPALDPTLADGAPNVFVDLYIKPANDTRPPELGETGQVYASVFKSNLQPGEIYPIPSTDWRPSSCPALPCPNVNWSQLMPPGTYNLFVMVDSIPGQDLPDNPFGYLQEAQTVGPDNGETDNVFGPIEFTVTESVLKQIYLPLLNNVVPNKIYVPVVKQ